jgi:acid phosphatase family membrane protein YuiD
MREFFIELWENRILMAAVIAWAIAQFLKTVIYISVYREWRSDRLWGSGGMPSSHAATVCALTVSALTHYGPASPVFAICFILAAVVLHDAHGVRLEAGKHAAILTAVTDILKKTHKGEIPEMELKELVGHTPLQVAVGSVIGIIVGLLVK